MSATRDPDRLHPAELAAATLLALLGLVCLLLWLAGGFAGILASGQWPDVDPGQLPQVGVGLHEHLADPREAWPAEMRATLPGPIGMYAGLLVAGVLLAGATAAALLLWQRAKRGRRWPAPDTASWARSRELAALRVPRTTPGRLTLGRHSRGLIAAEAGQSALVIAPTQTGKTTGLAVPAILEWPGPVVAASVKNDLLRDTWRCRERLGDVHLFDPASSTGRPSQSWTPLAGCFTWDGARRTAHWLTDGASSSKKGLSDADFWYSAAAKLLAPVLFAAAVSGHTMADVVTWIDTQNDGAVLDILNMPNRRRTAQGLPAMPNPPADAFQATMTRDERQRSSVYTTAETVLEAYADPGVLAHSETCDISPADLLDGCGTLYLSATVREQRRLRPVFVALLEAIIEEAYNRAARQGSAIDPPLLVVLDEAANIAPLPDLDVIAATGAGHGVQLVTVLQDLAQAHDRWGRERAETIINNHRAKLIGAGTADSRTLDYAARLLGDARYSQESSSVTSGRRTETEGSVYRMLAPPNTIRQGRTRSALLIYGHLPPAWIALRPWFGDRELSALARGEASSGRG